MNLTVPSYNPPSSSYGAPSSYTNVGGGGYYAPPPAGGGHLHAPYPGYFSDLELLVKLGQAALIVFIIFAVVVVLFLLVMACVYCARGGSRDSDHVTYYPGDGGPVGGGSVHPRMMVDDGKSNGAYVGGRGAEAGTA